MTTFLILLCCCVTSEVIHLFSSEELLPLLHEVSEGALAAFFPYSLGNLCCTGRDLSNITRGADSMVLQIIRHIPLCWVSTGLDNVLGTLCLAQTTSLTKHILLHQFCLSHHILHLLSDGTAILR